MTRVMRQWSVLGLLTALAASHACGAVDAPVERRTADIRLAAEAVRTIEDRIPVRATLDSVLRRHDVDTPIASRVVDAAQRAFNLRELRAGQPYRIAFSLDGVLHSFEYVIDRDRFLRVTTPAADESGEAVAEIVEYPATTIAAVVTGGITADRPSLIAAVADAGEQLELALLLADVFGGQVDFNSDLQPGDRFEALVEREFRDGKFVGYGDIVAATLVNDGRRLQAFRFTQEDGRIGYFDESGQSVRRLFLPSPLPFDPRVTSRFSRRRAHPVDGVPRAHLGVDYAAAVGTPVLAVADGVVVSAGFSGASGRMIRLRHGNGYETYYLHLSSFAAGMRRGRRVSQGDMIGRVGATGRVTGPHLDYRVSKNGVFVDPLAERRKMPGADPVPRERLAAFGAARDDARAEIARLIQAPDVPLDAQRNRLPVDSVGASTPSANGSPLFRNE
jgi:murein DD-endopeptidase MepM/ murein hydrolase activator NlpD